MTERIDEMAGIATLTLGKVTIEHETGMLNHIYPIGRRFQRIIIKGQDIIDGRNLAVKIAEDENLSFLMFWDDDIVPQLPSAFGLIMAAFDAVPDADIVGGVYPRRGLLCDPIVIKEPGGGVWWGWKEGAPYSIHKVYMSGTGFMGIRMSSLKKLDVPTYTVYDQDAHIRMRAKGIEDVKVPESTEVKRYFDNTSDARTDDFYFADLCLEQGLNWYVAGGAICDQIDLDGTRYRVQDAEIKVFNDGPPNTAPNRKMKVLT